MGKRQYDVVTAKAGFTLLELAVVLLLLSITASIAIPAWRSLLADNRLNIAANSLVLDLQRARSEALKRNAVVLVCAGDIRSGCRDPGEWSAGWIVAVDINGDGQANPPDSFISETKPEPNTLIRSTRRSAPIAFHYDGRSPGSNTTWSFCDPHAAARTRKVVLSNEGRIRTTSAEAAQHCA